MDNNLYLDSENDTLDLIVRRSGAFNCAIIPNTERGGRTIRDRGGRRRGRGFNFAQNNNSTSRQERAPEGIALIASTDGRARAISNVAGIKDGVITQITAQKRVILEGKEQD